MCHCASLGNGQFAGDGVPVSDGGIDAGVELRLVVHITQQITRQSKSTCFNSVERFAKKRLSATGE
jgi:hypothetical protein